MNVGSGFQLGDVWGIVRRRGKLVAGTALGVTLAAYWLAMALPNEYESYATVLVEPQTVAPELVEAGVPESDLNKRLGLMTAQILSRPRLSRIIDDLGLYEEESSEVVREAVIDLMRNHVRVEPVLSELESQAGARHARTSDEINTFRIFFRDDDPVVAKQVAQRLANDFIESHISERVRLSQKSVEFIEGELARLAARIRQIESRVAEVKGANPGRLPEDMGANQRRLERIMTDLAFTQRALADARSDEAFYRSQAANVRDLGTRDETSPTRRIQLIELAMADLRSRGFTAKHPDILKLSAELDQLRVQVEASEGEDAEPDAATSAAQQNLEAERLRAEQRRVSAEAEIARLQVMADEVSQLLAESPRVAEQLDGLQREYRHLFQSYQDFSNRRLEATVQAQLERRQLGEQFRVLEAAFVAPQPSSPNRPLIFVLGAMFGLAVGAGVGMVLESIDSSVHTSQQLQAAIGLPVLAAIPQVQLEADRIALRRRRIRTALATSAVTILALTGGAANYFWVNGGLKVEPAATEPAPGAAPEAELEPGAPSIAEPPEIEAPSPVELPPGAEDVEG